MGSLAFDAPSHTYTLDEQPVWRSVTGVLKAAGLVDFAGVPGGVLEAARTRGTIVHQAIHFYNERDLDLAAFGADFPDYAGYLEAWITFCQAREFQPVLNEHRVASRRLNLAGTIDCLGVLDGRAALIDFATGDPANVAKDLQTAGYLLLAREWAPEDPAIALFLEAHPVVSRYAVQLRADGRCSIEAYTDPTDTRSFLALVEAQRVVAARGRVEVDHAVC